MMQRYTVEQETDGVVITVGDKAMLFPNVSVEQMRGGRMAYMEGAYVQDAYPFLTPDQREFLMTGFTPDEWTELFGEEEY
jgi:hypothetical protein